MRADSDPPDPSVDLLKRWQNAGDREALDELLRIEVESLKRHIQGRGGRLPAALSASDVAQEAVLNLVKVREQPSFQEPAALRAYLWKSALRLLAAHLERAGSKLERLDASASRSVGLALATTGGLGAVEEQERALALEFALQLLEPEEQRILALVYFEQVPLDQAAARLSVNYETAKKRLSRARGRLALKLGDWSERLA
jgi:RNA polymerase sigma factor (sigma-70 family)